MLVKADAGAIAAALAKWLHDALARAEAFAAAVQGAAQLGERRRDARAAKAAAGGAASAARRLAVREHAVG